MPKQTAFSNQPRGFSLIEILIALLITMLVMTSVFLLLQKSQKSFAREPEVTDMNANARAGLDRISQDLAVAGFATPSNMAVMWSDGGGLTPDRIGIVYADPEVPVSRPRPCPVGGPCATIGTSTVVSVDPFSLSPQPPNFSEAYQEGMVLFAIQGPNGDPACDTVAPGLVPFQLAGTPTCTGAGGPANGPAACETLNLTLGPALSVSDLDPPTGFESDVSLHCAAIGLFHVVQYRVNPLPPADNPQLERRDASLGEPWSAVAGNIENLQVQYVQGLNEVFEDAPALLPMGADPTTWVTRVRITVAGRSESTNLEGATHGVYAAGDTHLRRTFTTTVSLRNQLSQAQQKAIDLGLDSWN
jgi:prepilin-type N-terminal cleavage/methylation domain-containing protein